MLAARSALATTSAATHGFPLCRDPRHEAVIRRVLDRCVRFLLERLPPGKLVALILTGSFARGEGSVISAGARLRVLGDIEFLVVFATEADYYTYRTKLPAWSREVGQAVADEVQVDVELGPSGVNYLRRRAQPSIFVYDLIHHGKVLWGPPDILDVVSRFRADRIPPEDALALLFNRTIEQLAAYDRVARLDGAALWDLAYQRLKLVLDIAGSALAFAGRHVSRYTERPGAFAELVETTPRLRDSLPSGFVAELERATRVKLAPGDGHAVLPSAPGTEAQRTWIRRQIVGGVPAVSTLLQWELESLLGVSGNLPTLLGEYVRSPRLSRRVWDWGKLLFSPTAAPVRVAPLRAARLFCRSTPRALLYAAGALAYLDLARTTVRPATIAHLLFVRDPARGRDAFTHRQTITALWRWCVRNT